MPTTTHGCQGMYNKAGYVLGTDGYWSLLAGIGRSRRPRIRPLLGSMAHVGCCFMYNIGRTLLMVYLNQFVPGLRNLQL